jgi:hypothetical protein
LVLFGIGKSSRDRGLCQKHHGHIATSILPAVEWPTARNVVRTRALEYPTKLEHINHSLSCSRPAHSGLRLLASHYSIPLLGVNTTVQHTNCPFTRAKSTSTPASYPPVVLYLGLGLFWGPEVLDLGDLGT